MLGFYLFSPTSLCVLQLKICIIAVWDCWCYLAYCVLPLQVAFWRGVKHYLNENLLTCLVYNVRLLWHHWVHCGEGASLWCCWRQRRFPVVHSPLIILIYQWPAIFNISITLCWINHSESESNSVSMVGHPIKINVFSLCGNRYVCSTHMFRKLGPDSIWRCRLTSIGNPAEITRS